MNKERASIKQIFKKSDKAYLEWLFPRNRGTLVDGLIFTFITITAISLVEYFYYAWEEIPNSFLNQKVDIVFLFRLGITPLVNIGAIFLARSSWNKSLTHHEWIAGVVIFLSMLGLLMNGLIYDYYTAVEGFAYDVLPLILFSQLLFGLTFRTSFLFNLVIILVMFTYLALDNSLIEDFIYTSIFVTLIWIPVLVGNLKLERSKVANFKIISKLEETHKELSQQKRLLREGEDASQSLSWRLSKDLKKVSYSEGVYAIYQFTKSEIKHVNLYHKIIPLIHPDDQEKVISEFQDLMNGKITPVTEHRILLSGGKEKWLKVTTGKFIEGEGYYGTIQDITKDKIMELELEQTAKALKMKNEDLQQFSYASSHDLQEPLRTITNFVSILNKQLRGQLSKDHKLYMDLILQSTGRMKNLINGILDYSRIGKNASLESFDCNEVVQSVVNDLSFALQESNGTIEAEPLPVIKGYKTDFSFLLQNLIGNALKFKRQGVPPLIKIRASSNRLHFHFYVEDNGIGMEKKHIKKIFQLFSRLHSKEEYEGTGIGLTHCKKIVELHGGRIWAESKVGNGTTFHFLISKSLKSDNNA